LSDKASFRYWLGAAAGALCAWLLCACILLLVFSLLFATDVVGLSYMGYAGSAISFLSALLAGMAAAARLKGNRLVIGIAGGVALSALLSLCGFLAASIDPSAEISVVSFSLVGFMLGAILPIRKKKRKLRRK